MKFDWIAIQAYGQFNFHIANASPADPYILKHVDGLGPSEFDVGISGRSYVGKRPRNKELSFIIKLNPNYAGNETVEELRDALYGVFEALNSSYAPDRRLIRVVLGTGDTNVGQTGGFAEIYGQATKVEPVLFEKESLVQITIKCVWPYFKKCVLETVEFGNPTDSSIFFVNDGTAPAGFRVMLSDLTGTWLTLENDWGGETMTIEKNFSASDELDIVNLTDNRAVYLNGNSIIGALSSDSDWFEVGRGNTNFVVTSDGGFAWEAIWLEKRYWGV